MQTNVLDLLLYKKQAQLKVVPYATTKYLFLEYSSDPNFFEDIQTDRQTDRPIEWVIEATSRHLKIGKLWEKNRTFGKEWIFRRDMDNSLITRNNF